MANERIQLAMTMQDIVMAMSEDSPGEYNPGAATACMEILKDTKSIDPDDLLEGLGPILTLDTLNIWGSDIYLLWNNVCRRDPVKMLAILRAYQLGQLVGCTGGAIKHAIENDGAGLELEAVLKAVQDKLPLFGIQYAQANADREHAERAFQIREKRLEGLRKANAAKEAKKALKRLELRKMIFSAARKAAENVAKRSQPKPVKIRCAVGDTVLVDIDEPEPVVAEVVNIRQIYGRILYGNLRPNPVVTVENTGIWGFCASVDAAQILQVIDRPKRPQSRPFNFFAQPDAMPEPFSNGNYWIGPLEVIAAKCLSKLSFAIPFPLNGQRLYDEFFKQKPGLKELHGLPDSQSIVVVVRKKPFAKWIRHNFNRITATRQEVAASETRIFSRNTDRHLDDIIAETETLPELRSLLKSLECSTMDDSGLSFTAGDPSILPLN